MKCICYIFGIMHINFNFSNAFVPFSLVKIDYFHMKRLAFSLVGQFFLIFWANHVSGTSVWWDTFLFPLSEFGVLVCMLIYILTGRHIQSFVGGNMANIFCFSLGQPPGPTRAAIWR